MIKENEKLGCNERLCSLFAPVYTDLFDSVRNGQEDEAAKELMVFRSILLDRKRLILSLSQAVDSGLLVRLLHADESRDAFISLCRDGYIRAVDYKAGDTGHPRGMVQFLAEQLDYSIAWLDEKHNIEGVFRFSAMPFLSEMIDAADSEQARVQCCHGLYRALRDSLEGRRADQAVFGEYKEEVREYLETVRELERVMLVDSPGNTRNSLVRLNRPPNSNPFLKLTDLVQKCIDARLVTVNEESREGRSLEGYLRELKVWMQAHPQALRSGIYRYIDRQASASNQNVVSEMRMIADVAYNIQVGRSLGGESAWNMPANYMELFTDVAREYRIPEFRKEIQFYPGKGQQMTKEIKFIEWNYLSRYVKQIEYLMAADHIEFQMAQKKIEREEKMIARPAGSKGIADMVLFGIKRAVGYSPVSTAAGIADDVNRLLCQGVLRRCETEAYYSMICTKGWENPSVREQWMQEHFYDFGSILRRDMEKRLEESGLELRDQMLEEYNLEINDSIGRWGKV